MAGRPPKVKRNPTITRLGQPAPDCDSREVRGVARREWLLSDKPIEARDGRFDGFDTFQKYLPRTELKSGTQK